MAKKVVFIEPTGAHANVFSKFMTIPLLGPVYLATIAKQAGYDASVLNENILGRHVTDEELASADILGLSCLTTSYQRGKDIAKQYKELRQARDLESRVIIGGIHASMMPDDTAEYPYFDQVFVGEAEQDILDLLAGKNLDRIVRGKRFEDLDQLPIPDFTLLKGHEKIKMLPMMTSRGCPYDCNFCSVTEMFGRGYRMQSAEKVMQQVRQHKREKIFFVDDNFAVSKSRTNKLLDMMMEEDVRIRWTTQLRTDVTKTPELVEKMRKAGCRMVYIGFESVNPASLEELNKNQSVDDIRRTIRVFHDNRINIHGMFMLGSDSDTPEVFKMTSDFARKYGIDTVMYSPLTPLPGTRFYARMEAEGRLLHKNWDYYDGCHAVFQPKNMTPEELQRGMLRCYLKFYSIKNGIKHSLLDTADTVWTALRNTYSDVDFPSWSPALMRFVGKGIVKTWIKDNRHYLDYLKQPWNLQLLPVKA